MNIIFQNSEVKVLFEKWKEAKILSPKTFRMAFSPNRYFRSCGLGDSGFNVYQKLVKINGEPYAVINFSLEGDYAFEMTFFSLYFDKTKKIINDQNDCIFISCLYDLYTNGIKIVNSGPANGMKGLSFFKHKLPYTKKIVYTN